MVHVLVLFWQLSEFFNNKFFKEREKHCYKKRHCFKKLGSYTYRKSYITPPRFMYFSTVHSKKRIYIVLSKKKEKEKITEI